MAKECEPPRGHPLTIEQAKELIAGELGEACERFISRCCAPIYWYYPGDEIFDNGTLTFVHTPHRLMAITAAHVVRGFQAAHAAAKRPIHLQVMNAILNLEPIAICDRLDLATLAIDDDLLARLGKEIQPLSTWPPTLPQPGRGIMLAGYPGGDRRQLSPTAVEWGLFTALGIARTVISHQITWVAERNADIITNLPLQHRLGGLSGGPLIGIFERPGGPMQFALSGIISQAHQELENVIARRADFINDDGSIIEPSLVSDSQNPTPLRPFFFHLSASRTYRDTISADLCRVCCCMR
jgi:hypothetical protein